MTRLAILDRIDATIAEAERPTATLRPVVLSPEPTRVPCRCSWCRRQGFTAVPSAPLSLAEDPLAGWVRPRRR